MQYIGTKMVLGVIESEKKTTLGNPVLSVLYEGDMREDMPKKFFELVVTEEPKDDTYIRDMKFEQMCIAIYPLLEEYQLEFIDLEGMTLRLKNKVVNQFNRAQEILWYGSDKGFVPGWNPSNNITLLQIKNVIDKNEPESKE